MLLRETSLERHLALSLGRYKFLRHQALENNKRLRWKKCYVTEVWIVKNNLQNIHGRIFRPASLIFDLSSTKFLLVR